MSSAQSRHLELLRAGHDERTGIRSAGHGSTALKGDRDYREVTVVGAFVVYYISAPVLVVTAVRIVH